MFSRASLSLFLLLVLFSSSGTTTPLQQAGRAGVGQRPEGWFGPGRTHRVYFRGEDRRELTNLRARGALRFEVDYGAFALALVDEEAFGGRRALRESRLEVRDDQDGILLDQLTLDGTAPEATLAGLDPEERIGRADAASIDPEAGLYLVQFVGPPLDEWLSELEAIGVRAFQPIPWNAYVVQAAPERAGALDALARGRPEIQYIGVYQPAFRMTPALRHARRARVGQPVAVTVQIVEGRGERAAIEELERLALRTEGHTRIGPYINLRLVLDPLYLPWMASRPSVFAIEERGVVALRDERQGQIVAGNVVGASPSAPTYLSWLASRGFNSTQFTSFSVNVVDDATSLTGHPDLASGRVAFAQNPTSQTGAQGGHGFLNAHIVAGLNSAIGPAAEDLAGYNYGLGIAPWARVGATAIFGPGALNPISYESDAYGLGARISTNSWSFETGGGAPIPDYDSSAQAYDFISRDASSVLGGNQDYLVIFSAGNEGPGLNSVSTPSTAKNVLTVGASENSRASGTDGCGIPNSGANDARDIISFSSRGPVNSSGGDGRWKPEIVAPGTHIQAGVPQSNYSGTSVCDAFWPTGQTLYGWSSGTSHSTPAVAGGAALVYQWFLNQSLTPPSAAMMKAVLVNGSEYLTGVGANDTLPSTSQGLGRMNLERAFDGASRLLVDQTELLSATGASYVLNGQVADPAKPVRFSLVWTDAPGATTGAPWINDLDLAVEVGASTFRGNVFSGALSTTGGSADSRNNCESVFLPAGTTGPFTVTVQASSIAGDGVPGNGDSTDQDFALVVYNATAKTGPLAQFTGAPTTGLTPLTVGFTDASSGNLTSWSWTFGDGLTSTLQNPTHEYTAAGTYDVSLTIDGPDGMDVHTRPAYITVNVPPPPGISDGSFELQTAATAPTTPWILSGSGHVVNPTGGSSDGAMPTHGSNWAEVAADSTNGATPPSNPGGFTLPPVGAAGISQDFTYPAGQAVLEFSAAFLRNENANQSTFNDFMSVDVTDGTTTYNLYHKDTFSSVSGTSAKYGFAITPIEAVAADLSALFPASTPSTLFTLTAQVGNGNDDVQPSKGYVDNFRLTPSAPLADFSGTPLSGVAPLDVIFSDLSTGVVTAWSWAFGDTGTSALQNPSHTYASAGTYTVSLTATGPGGSDVETKVGYVVVSELAPVADFAGTPLSGVSPLDVTFSDLSTGVVTAWSWAFGDTGTSALQNPSHTYLSAGTYSVSLTATGPGGSGGETKVGYVVVSEPAPIAEFSGTPLTGASPLDVTFSDLSTGAVTAWSWAFGDTGTSTLQDPSHTYASAGTYMVSLTATGPGGSDVETKVGYVVVSEPSPIAEFSGTPLTGASPLEVTFSDLSTGVVTAWSWAFGDTGTSTLQNPSHTYASAGTYSVSLTATGPGGSDVETKVGYVVVSEPAPIADFSGTPLSGFSPLDVTFSDLSTGAVTAWSWAFGDTGTSTLQNPSHTYASAGTYSVSLTATGPGGSDGETKVGYVVVSEPAPIAEFSGTPLTGASPLDVTFSDLSTGVVTAWSWAFGDTGTSTLQNPSHTYLSAGTYAVSLTATGLGGSDVETKVGYVVVNEPSPIADFSGTPLSGVSPLDVTFSDLSTGAVTAWSWDFGDTGTSTLQNPSHSYASAGTYTVSLTATGPGGSDVETKVGYVVASEPAPNVDFSGTPLTGIAPLTVAFSDLSTGSVTAWSWTFGDTGTSTLQSPDHTYAAAGAYTVSLTVAGPGGSNVVTKVGYVVVSEPPPVAEFSGTPLTATAPLRVQFSDLSSGVVTGWSWDFGDGSTSTLQSPSHRYRLPGVYSVTLTVMGPNGDDSETKTDYILARGPYVGVSNPPGSAPSVLVPLSASGPRVAVHPINGGGDETAVQLEIRGEPGALLWLLCSAESSAGHGDLRNPQATRSLVLPPSGRVSRRIVLPAESWGETFVLRAALLTPGEAPRWSDPVRWVVEAAK